jgi:HD-like signal output (HDOD) protein
LGAYLLSLWGFGDSIVQAVAFHHNPQRSLTAKVTVLTAVHIANIVEHDTRPDNRICRPPVYDDQYLEQVGAPRRGSALEVATEKESTAPSGDGR